MRIGLDIGPVTQSRSGVGNYCLNLLRGLLELDGLEIAGFAASARKLDLEAIGRPLPHRHLHIPTRVMYQIWSALGWPKVDALLGGVDVYHATNYFLPPVRRAKRVLTIHDIAFKKHPELCSPKIVGPFSKKVGGFAREADAVIADSESTRQDIIELLGVSAERVHTVHLAVEEGMKPVLELEARKHVAQVYGIHHPYLLFVGTIEPRKNIVNIARAFRSIETEYPHRLVLAGGKGWLSDEIDTELVFGSLDEKEMAANLMKAEEKFGEDLSAENMLNRIRPLGFVQQDDLPALYSAADALVFPSFYEGFGLPILEAMACGCPVITANNSSLPEVAGDAAEYCDANDVYSIANAML